MVCPFHQCFWSLITLKKMKDPSQIYVLNKQWHFSLILRLKKKQLRLWNVESYYYQRLTADSNKDEWLNTEIQGYKKVVCLATKSHNQSVCTISTLNTSKWWPPSLTLPTFSGILTNLCICVCWNKRSLSFIWWFPIDLTELCLNIGLLSIQLSVSYL